MRYGYLLALALVAFDVGAQSAGSMGGASLEYGYPEQPPRAFTNAQGQPDGHYPRLLKQLFARADIAWHGASYPAKRLMSNLQQGTTQFSILVRNAILDECCLYGTEPVWYDELRVYRLGGKPAILRKEELIGKQLIVLAGFSYGGLIAYLNDPANRIQVLQASSHTAAFAMLGAGRADYLLDYSEAAQAEVSTRLSIPNLQSDVIDVVNMYFVLNRKYPQAPATLERLEALYRVLRSEDVKHEYTKPPRDKQLPKG